MLQRQARLQPDKVFARFEDGTCWTYAQTLEEARRVGASLLRLGVGLGDPVLCWLPNGKQLLRTWFGINLRGAVYVPVNTAYRGSLLERVVCDSGARVLVAHHALLERLADIDTGALTDVVVAGARPGDAPLRNGLRALDERLLDTDSNGWRGPERPLEPWDLQAILYTSGTTGPSKGVLVTYRHHSSACGVVPAAPDDKYLINSPAVPRRRNAARDIHAQGGRLGRDRWRVQHHRLLERDRNDRRELLHADGPHGVVPRTG